MFSASKHQICFDYNTLYTFEQNHSNSFFFFAKPSFNDFPSNDF